MEIGQFIVKTPGTCGGRARVAGRRVPVSSVYRWFLSGFGPEDILEKYEGATLAEIYAAITYALANRDEIGAEIELEDRLENESLERDRQRPAVSARACCTITSTKIVSPRRSQPHFASMALRW
jgi:uncharacterized protein (DUF433 family)